MEARTIQYYLKFKKNQIIYIMLFQMLTYEVPVQATVLDRFGEMSGLEVFLAFEVGNSSSYLQDACISPGAQSKFINGHL